MNRHMLYANIRKINLHVIKLVNIQSDKRRKGELCTYYKVTVQTLVF